MGGGAIQAAIFAAGAVVGGGIATVIANKRREVTALPPRPAIAQGPPVVGVDVAGKPHFEPPKGVQIVPSLPPVLRNGHPGAWFVQRQGTRY